MKRYAPATARNSDAIAEVLARELPETGLVLEIASGTGEHAVFMARRFPGIEWQPSDPDIDALQSIASWTEEAGFENLRQPLELDVREPNWPVHRADAVVCINMIHISPWAATEGLFAGASRLLEAGSPLITYGPYFEDEVETAPSNLAFDESLRSRNPEWGIRNVAALDELADRTGFARSARHEMPANNLMLVYRR
ncbi:DUF938 domain-containing protein [Qipengyuania vesicularis]|uniref:DUF938 domain-containing protein n=1 Tax=Qipengyuania vesicularis TaxID=2867232 RepID=UPI001C877FF4|nr:DUF938 domain-containing protein [Qipengyuania vesicularis]MBX7526235.1 DUF938 domain-containing protein [Qipengyuania vesicularis]